VAHDCIYEDEMGLEKGGVQIVVLQRFTVLVSSPTPETVSSLS
jgi:hypothetical protein